MIDREKDFKGQGTPTGPKKQEEISRKDSEGYKAPVKEEKKQEDMEEDETDDEEDQ